MRKIKIFQMGDMEAQILGSRKGMKNGKGEQIKVGKVIKEARGQELSLGRLDSEISRGKEMDRMKRKQLKRNENTPGVQNKNPDHVFDISSHARYYSCFITEMLS